MDRATIAKIRNTLVWGESDISSFGQFKQRYKKFYSKPVALLRIKSCIPEIVALFFCSLADNLTTQIALGMGFTEKNSIMAGIQGFWGPLSWIVSLVGAVFIGVWCSYMMGKWACRFMFLFWFFLVAGNFWGIFLAWRIGWCLIEGIRYGR